MAEPSRANLVQDMSNFVGTAPSFIHHREELSQFKSIPQEMPSGTLRHALSEPTLSTSLEDRTESHCWARLAKRRDQDGEPCCAHIDEAIKVSRLDSSMWSNAVFSLVLPCARS